MTNAITIDDIMSKKPCPDYPRARVEKLFGNRKSVSYDDILDSSIVHSDKIWLITRFLTDRQNRLLACDCAESVLHIFEKRYADDGRPRAAIEMARKYANGECTIDELIKARAAATATAYATAAYAANDAAAYAANDAAAYAAYDAAAAANDAAANDAAANAAAARKVEQQKQIEVLCKYCQEI